MDVEEAHRRAAEDTEAVEDSLRALLKQRGESLRSVSLALGKDESWLWGQFRRKGALPLRVYLLVCHLLETHPAKPFIEAVPGMSEYLATPGGVDLVALQESMNRDLKEMIRREVEKRLAAEPGDPE